MQTVNTILKDIKEGNAKPIYFLMGEEPHYIDKISDWIEDNILDESEKGFNQMVMYGRDTTVEDIIGAAKRYPMMAEKQVIIVKEAQDLSRTIEKLEPYAAQPQPTTVLVLCYKYKKLDKRKMLHKTIQSTGVIFESKKLYENEIPSWIARVLKSKNYHIEHKASQMLVEFLGTELSKISNELNKLMLILPENSTITDKHIEENIGISKDFNNFELRKAIGDKNVVKANRIINYFADNPKNNPIVVTIALIHSFFTQLLLFHGLKDKSKKGVAQSLKVSIYFVDDYFRAAKNYPMRKVAQIISYTREADVKSKGVGVTNASHPEILKELLFKILH
ncbi:MAG: DNA polymerase III subunit delta [Polaribacter sp.]|jgi:DNA polymerase-3 subunit delta